jgi:RNA polymerase subunit RPABC4/transcription elongation factor Spt4
MVFFVFIIWAVLSVVIGYGAQKRNRSFAGFIVLSLLTSPLIALIVLLALGEKQAGTSGYSSHSNSKSPNERYLGDNEIKCKSCGKIMADEYKRCPDCGSTEFSRKGDDVLNVKEIIKVTSSNDLVIICPYCKAHIKVDVPFEQFKQIKCDRCQKTVNKKDALIAE